MNNTNDIQEQLGSLQAERANLEQRLGQSQANVRRLQNPEPGRSSTSVLQQRTLDDKVRFGIPGVEALYRVTGLQKDSSGKDIPERLYKTNFQRSFSELGERRQRDMMQSLDHIVNHILDV